MFSYFCYGFLQALANMVEAFAVHEADYSPAFSSAMASECIRRLNQCANKYAKSYFGPILDQSFFYLPNSLIGVGFVAVMTFRTHL